jgi:hypothetical protein
MGAEFVVDKLSTAIDILLHGQVFVEDNTKVSERTRARQCLPIDVQIQPGRERAVLGFGAKFHPCAFLGLYGEAIGTRECNQCCHKELKVLEGSRHDHDVVRIR